VGLPRMTAKRWFWSLTGLLALYLVLALRFDTAGSPAEAGRAVQAQSGVSGIINSLLLPASWAITKAQSLFSHPQGNPLSQADMDALNEKIKTYESQLNQAKTELTAARIELAEMKELRQRFPDLSRSAKFLSPVNIVGYSASGSSETITIDAGLKDGLKNGMPVIADFAPVGKIIAAGPATSVVRLITEPGKSMTIKAQIQRSITDGNGQRVGIIEKSCSVEGLGNGMLTCRDVNINTRFAPEVGDMLVINGDPTWKGMDGAFIGQVDHVGRTSNPDLRFDLRIKPYADIANLRHVMVILQGE